MLFALKLYILGFVRSLSEEWVMNDSEEKTCYKMVIFNLDVGASLKFDSS